MKYVAPLFLASIVSVSALASHRHGVTIRRDSVIQITMESELSLKNSRPGDRFFACVADDKDIPRGSRLQGRILDIRESDENRPGTMDLAFNRIVLPDGTWSNFRGVPISLSMAKRGRDGRFTINQQKVRKENYVLGGIAAGAILGSTIKKPFEGAFLGAIAGIILGEGEGQKNSGQVVIKKGQSLGALVQEDFDISIQQREERPAYAPREDLTSISIDGRSLSFDENERPYRVGNVIMVPAVATAKHSRVDIDFSNGGKTIYLENQDNVLKIELDSKECRLNGRRDTLVVAPERVRNTVYVPLELFSKLGYSTSVHNAMTNRQTE